MNKQKLKKLLYGIGNRQFFKTKILDIGYQPYELRDEMHLLLNHGLIIPWSVGYYKRLFDNHDVDKVYKKLCKEMGL